MGILCAAGFSAVSRASFLRGRWAGSVAIGLALFVAGLTAECRAQDSFYSPYNLNNVNGDWGSVTNDNTGVVPDTNCPSIAGFAPNAPLWYTWTAPKSGVMELDTLGSVSPVVVTNLSLVGTNLVLAVVTNYYPLDTTLSVFTGSSLNGLSQVAASDDIYPINSSTSRASSQQASISQFNLTSSGDYAILPGSLPEFAYVSPYYGPSHLKFNAIAGTTYYFAVDTKVETNSLTLYPKSPTGPVALNWAYQSSGVFRFATENFDAYTGMPLYEAAQTESDPLQGTSDDVNSAVLTYYSYNPQGVLVTVTRVGGSSGRCTVDYTTEPGTNLPTLPFRDAPAVPGVDYVPVHGTLVFDDYEMSKTILIPINDTRGGGSGGTTRNTCFGVVLSNPQVDPNEGGDISQPRVDPTFGTAIVRILNQEADPYGPDLVPVTMTNTIGTNVIISTNLVVALYPTNAIFGFEKCNYRVPEDVTDGRVSPWTHVAIYVERFGTNLSAETLNYRINNFMGDDQDGNEEQNIYFPLQPGSDYAVPTPPNSLPIRGTNSDFTLAQGTISFPAGGSPAAFYQEITFTVTNLDLTKFNKDFKIELYREASYNNQTVPWLAGMVDEATVTILFNDQHPPAGSVDEFYDADFNNLMALPQGLEPQTTPQKDAFPGVAGIVYSVAVLTNGEALVGGDFASFNGLTFADGNPTAGLVLVDTNGNLDTSFELTAAPDGPVYAVAQTWGGKFLVGGGFDSLDGGQGYLSRLNPDGSLDTSFNPTIDGAVKSIAVQPDGKFVIGGAFTHVDGTEANGLARLNNDGSLDTSFNPGTTLNGTVNAVAIMPGTITNRTANGSSLENDMFLNVGTNAVGRITVQYSFPTANEMQVFYGGNPIFDTGVTATSGNAQFSVPFAAGNTPLEVVVNPGGAQPAADWSYTATIQTNSDVMAGGSFSVAGEPYSNLARFTPTGLLDNTFSNSFQGVDNAINAVAWQPDGKVLIGGAFAHYNGTAMGGIARVNWDGSLDQNFFIGSGADDEVWNLTLQPDGTIYVGGQFTSINGTHRLGFARLLPDGTVDTSFMDPAYNQFAGLKKIFADDLEAVYASAIQSDGNVIIGGLFNQVGGGQALTNVCDSLDDAMGIPESFDDPNLWVEPKSRDGVQNRESLARLIGGSTPGPGNIGFQATAFSGNKSQTSLSVALVRTNGALGPVSANFSVLPGLAQSGSDYGYDSTPPIFWLASQFTVHPSRDRSEGLFGLNGDLQDIYGLYLTLADLPINEQSGVSVSIINNSQKSGNLNAQFQLSNPSGDSEFYLGGENIPVCSALGESSAPFTIIDDTSQSGTFSFLSPEFIATNGTAIISIMRSNGVFGTVTMRCFATNGTAVAGVDYRGVTNLLVQFAGITSNSFPVTILNQGLISTNFTEKTVNLSFTSLSGGNAAYGVSNAVLRIINPNFQGYLTLSASNYMGNEKAGFMAFTVNRVAGSSGEISAECATFDQTAHAGVNYIGVTNLLTWYGGDASPRTIVVPLINGGVVGGAEHFGISLFDPTNNAGAAPALFYPGSPGSITNATVTITNDDSYGQLQFSSPDYLGSELGGYATITVVRTGGAVGTATVNYYTSDGSNTLAGNNYVATNGVLSFGSNQISASFNVSILNDGVQDLSNFFFNVTLSNAINATLGSPTNAMVNILDANTYNWPPGTTNAGFKAEIDNDVLTLALQTNGQILVGGKFQSVDGVPQDYIARLNTDGSLDPDFSGTANGLVQTILNQTDGNILLGGSFGTVDGLTRHNIARLTSVGTLDTTFNPGSGANGAVNVLAETFIGGSREIYVGGAFSTISSGSGNSTGNSPYLARLYNNGSLDTTFNTGQPGPDGPVYAIAVYPTNSIYAGDVLVGGSFAHYNGTTVNGIVRLTASGAMDSSFNPGAAATNGVVDAIAIQPDGRIIIGGTFVAFGGVTVNNITRLNSDGSVDMTFVTNLVSGADNTVNGIILQPDNRILVVGQFSEAGGLARNGITRLLPSGANDYSINFGTGANGAVDAVVVQPATGVITIGGAFTEYDEVPADHIAQVYGNSETGSGSFEFSADSYQIAESGVSAPITVIRTGGTSGPNSDGSGNIVVNFSTETNTGTAVPGVNYSPISTNLTFVPGQTYQIVTVPILAAPISNTNSWDLYMDLANPTPPAILGSPHAGVELTIQNTNSAVSFQNAFPSVFENVAGGIANITVVRQGYTNGTSYVNLATTTNGTTGIPFTDYYPTNETLTFNPGDSQINAQVLIISNSTLEKTIGLVLTNPVNTTIYSPSNAILSVDSSTRSPGQIYFASTSYVVNESSNVATITLLRTNGLSDDVTYGYTTIPGTAQPGVNYLAPVNGTVTFSGSSSSAQISVTILQDPQPFAPATFQIVLTNSDNSDATVIPPTNTTVTILDDINSGVAFYEPTNYFEETNGQVPVLVQRLGNTNNSFSVNFATSDGTAVAGVDYITNSGMVNFIPGESLQSIPVTLINNENVSNLTFTISLSGPTDGVQLGTPAKTVVVEEPAAAGLSFGTSSNSVMKNAGSITIPVICLNPTNEPPIIDSNSVPLSVHFSTADGTAQAGSDYVATNGVLVFTNGIATNTITVPILNNSLITGLRTFSVKLFNVSPVPPGKLVAPTNELIAIIDNNTGLAFSSPNYSINGGGQAIITVVRTDNTNRISTVDYSTISGGSAVPNTDYYPTNGTLTFLSGQTTASFGVTVIGSSAAQPDKTIILQLSNPTNGIITAPDVSTLTIYNQIGGYIVPAGVSLFATNGAPNGILQPGQQVALWFGFRDANSIDVSNVYATLLPVNGISSPNPASAVSYGPLKGNGHAGFQHFAFTPVGTNSQTIQAMFALQVVGTNGAVTPETNAFALTLGTWKTTFSNTNTITIFAAPAQGVAMIASNYPSIITVTNVGGVLVDATVTFTNFFDTSPQAVGALVVSPAQEDTLLMSGVGTPNVEANDVTITFSDAATNSLPSTTSPPSNLITNGVYKPTQDGAIPNFP